MTDIQEVRGSTPSSPPPLFSVTCAVVCDTGGSLSHTANVAREYGMPAVLGTGNATSVLEDGDVVTVDGYKGIIVISKWSA